MTLTVKQTQLDDHIKDLKVNQLSYVVDIPLSMIFFMVPFL